ncbi:hypothetical protein FIC_00670 [Flavobacteriaceae bacterium 3519-10]|nr:hypothetical protein FIC_00670 [Flavobacteriaceae bacterium 3519-10]
MKVLSRIVGGSFFGVSSASTLATAEDRAFRYIFFLQKKDAAAIAHAVTYSLKSLF